MLTPRSREDWWKKDPRHEDHNHNHLPVHRERFQDRRSASWKYRSCLKRENTVRYTSNKRETGKLTNEFPAIFLDMEQVASIS